MRFAVLLSLVALALPACQGPLGEPGSAHAIFATELYGTSGGNARPTGEALWTLQAKAAQTCPQGYDWLDEGQRNFSQGREWVWWIRCAAA